MILFCLSDFLGPPRNGQPKTPLLVLQQFIFAALFFISPLNAQELTPVDKCDVLRFSVVDGDIHNEFYRCGAAAAHIVLTAGKEPRLVVAFPAGNSGVSLWLNATDDPVEVQTIESVNGVQMTNSKGQRLYGVTADITLKTNELVVNQAVLGSLRTIRTYLHEQTIPKQIQNEFSVSEQTVRWQRQRLDGLGAYQLSVEVLDGSYNHQNENDVHFHANTSGILRLRLVALTGDTPLTPIPTNKLLTVEANSDPLARQVLAFLSYEEKLLAGSWRFLTYFGRDTLLSTLLLMPNLKPQVIEAALGSVLERINDKGEVAHEEGIGEFAVLENIDRHESAEATAVFDYNMVDDNYMLLPVLADYLADNPRARNRSEPFLQRTTSGGERYGDVLVRNIRFVLSTARPFVESPEIDNLIGLKSGRSAGQWRDSDEGLGGGKYAYDVNVALLPAALKSIVRLDGVLEDYLPKDLSIDEVKMFAAVWSTKVPPLFLVEIQPQQARQKVLAYARNQDIDDNLEKAELHDTSIRFNAVALRADGQQIPVLHSDIGFTLLFNTPPAKRIEEAIDMLMKPFPVGLITPVGMVVANPVYASSALQDIFTDGHYHGTVIWSWHHALVIAGIDRQLKRQELPKPLRVKLRTARTNLWAVVRATKKLKSSELWSWVYQDGQYKVALFGQSKNHKTESNAAQLWSTVFLSLHE